jgi:hypothetical protein
VAKLPPPVLPDYSWASAWAPFPSPVLVKAEWDEIIRLVDQRCHGRCEGCANPFGPGVRGMSLHHRRNKAMGGTDDPTIHGLANLLALCGGKLAGVTGCHGKAETLTRETAEARGLIVRHDAYLPGPGVEPPEVSAELHLAVSPATPRRPVIYRRVLLDPRTADYLDPPGGSAYVA